MKIKSKEWELSPHAVDMYEKEFKGNLIFDISYSLFLQAQVERDDLSETQWKEAYEGLLRPLYMETILQVLAVTYRGKDFNKVLKHIGTDRQKAMEVFYGVCPIYFRYFKISNRTKERLLETSRMVRV